MNTIIANCKVQGIGVIATSSTGVSAILIEGGTTVHSAFFIPIDLDAQTEPRLQYQSARAEQIRNAKLIFIDEYTMLNKEVFAMVDKTIRSVMPAGPLRDLPFGGKTIVPSGDWKQLLCVVQGEHKIG